MILQRCKFDFCQKEIGDCQTCRESIGKVFEDFSSEHSLQWQKDYLIAIRCRPMEEQEDEKNCIDGATNWWSKTSRQIFTNNRATQVCTDLTCTETR